MDRRLHITKKFAELYVSLKGYPKMEEMIADAFDNYITDENIHSDYDRMTYRRMFRSKVR